SGDIHKGVEYCRRAGDRALSLLAHDEAADHYRRTLELLEPSGDSRLRAELLLLQGEAQRRAGDAAHRETLLESARLGRQVGDVATLAAAALANHRGFWSLAGEVDAERVAALEAALDAVGDDDPGTRARLLAVLAQELVFGFDLPARMSRADEAVRLARISGDSVILAEVLIAWHMAAWTAST